MLPEGWLPNSGLLAQTSPEYSYAFIADCIQCDAKTLRNYFNRTTKGGKYLTRLLELLDISVKEWNNALDEDEKEKEAQKL